jgi:hypothetical protein
MTVADLIEELRQLPQYYPIMCDMGMRYPESINSLDHINTCSSKTGPMIVIRTDSDPRNYKNEWEIDE